MRRTVVEAAKRQAPGGETVGDKRGKTSQPKGAAQHSARQREAKNRREANGWMGRGNARVMGQTKKRMDGWAWATVMFS